MKQKKGGVTSWGMKTAPYFLIAPCFLIFFTFVIIPALTGFYYSFTEWDGLKAMTFTGLDNYIKAFQSKEFWASLGRTFRYVLITVPLIMACSLFLANLLIKEIRCKGFFRAVFYWPTMISFIVVGISFKFLFGDSFGAINYILTALGLEAQPWLTNGTFATIVVVLATVWSRAGFYMLTFISGLQNIPESYYEACAIDGAKAHQKFFFVTLPLLKPTLFLVFILSIIDTFKAYGLVISLTNGGPSSSTKFVVQHIYQEAFEGYRMGYASTLSMILLVILAIFTGIQFKLSRGGEV